jgi:hypothetical protein
MDFWIYYFMAKKSTRKELPADEDLLSPCGIFCGICGGYLAYKNSVPKRRGIITHCEGCRPRDKQCSFLKKRCEKLLNHTVDFCYECSDFPCINLSHIDKKYQRDFGFSNIETLKKIKEKGSIQVMAEIKEKFRCHDCGQDTCVHNRICYVCQKDLLSTMPNYKNKIEK